MSEPVGTSSRLLVVKREPRIPCERAWELVQRLGSAIRRIVRQRAVLALVGVWLTILVGVVGAFTTAAFEATVVDIADGDTLTVLREDRTQVRVRLHGIDAPENGQPFWVKAKAFTSELAHRKVVRVEPTDLDHDGHMVAYVRLPHGRTLNHELVRVGLAWWRRIRWYAPHDAALEHLEAGARGAGRGLWADLRPVPPWWWRAPVGATTTRQAAPRWLLQVSPGATDPGEVAGMGLLQEWPVVHAYDTPKACERARDKRLNRAERVTRCVPAP